MRGPNLWEYLMTLHVLTAASFYDVIEPVLIGQTLRYYDLDYLVPLGVGDSAEEPSNITLMPAHVHATL